MTQSIIFVIDDEANIRAAIESALGAEGYSVHAFESPLEALKAVPKLRPELMITDLVMPELDGLKLIQRVKAIDPEMNVVVITAHASLESAVGAIRLGASDYLAKPFKIEDLSTAVRKALSQKRFNLKESSTDKTFSARYRVKNLIGNTPEIKAVFELLAKISKTESTVLIMGESGTGKEVVARSIHYQSKRSKGPFVSINCAALPETLLESELFGYEKGAFTGAQGSKPGLFELAEDGTFLLDEIGEMPVSLQVKLLRVLQERVLKHLGGVRDIPVDFRLIAATSKNLPAEIKAGKFREDLFYRLNVIPIFMPPLRERVEDIPLFVDYFVKALTRKEDSALKCRMTPEAIKTFRQYSWPGNIRELENVVERMITLASAEKIGAKETEAAIQAGRVSESPIGQTPAQSDLRRALESFERDLIEKAISETHGNKNRAAKKLHLTRQALQYKLQKYGLQ